MDRKLIDYLSPIMQTPTEMQAIMQTEQIEFEKAWSKTSYLLDNQFISTANEIGVSRWEKILNITPKATDDIDERKFRILTRFNEQIPYTMRILEQQLELLCGVGEYSVELGLYTIFVKVSLVAKSNFDDIKNLLNRVIPANMIIVLTLKYNRHLDLKKFTHGQLSKFTHLDLRNGVLNNE